VREGKYNGLIVQILPNPELCSESLFFSSFFKDTFKSEKSL